jgi:CubicO group peptidase (beta-lactamase class C family)
MPANAAPGPTPPVPADGASRVLRALVPVVNVKGRAPVRYSIEQRMVRLHVPGVSVAVVDRGAMAWVRAFGVTPTMPFQAASIGKVLTATATLRLVERGRLSLDENVNAYLTSWKVRLGMLVMPRVADGSAR